MSFDVDESEYPDSGDPHVLLFGEEPHEDEAVGPDQSTGGPYAPSSRSRRRGAQRRVRRRRFFAVLIVLVLAAAGLTAVLIFNGGSSSKDYSGSGTGSVTIQVQQGDGIDAIGQTLTHAGVVGSVNAFRTAAAANSNSSNIAPGYYKLRKRMSASSALDLLLNPASAVNTNVVIPEGLIEKEIVAKLATALGLSTATVQQAADKGVELAPGGYAPTSGSLKTLEGFLYPATYQFDPGTTADDAIEILVARYVAEDRQLGFASAAVKMGITPYAALTIASIAQAEVKFADDSGKVARVILNRLAAGMPLQIDATSAYAAKMQGLDPAKVVYATLVSPYNTYLNKGLPPTPIGSPGETSMTGAVNPPAGTWLYYVNDDAAGHLGFYSDQADFTAAQQKCYANNWGCAAP